MHRRPFGRILLPFIVVIAFCGRSAHNFPHNVDSGHSHGHGHGHEHGHGHGHGHGHDGPMDIIAVEEVVNFSSSGKNTTTALVTLDEPIVPSTSAGGGDVGDDDGGEGSESMMDALDDLIFLTRKPNQRQQQQRQQQQNQEGSNNPSATDCIDSSHHQIDFLTSAEEREAEDSLTSASTSMEAHDHHGGGGGGARREMQLRSDRDGADTGPVPTVDMSDFLAMIPADEVKLIASHYYLHDPDVRNAVHYLGSHEFAALKEHAMDIPEVVAFMRYLNYSGLDIKGFLHAVTNMTVQQMPGVKRRTKFTLWHLSSIEEVRKLSEVETVTNPPRFRPELPGLNGMVDTVLNVLPQDRILSTFFDKLETDENFARMVDRITSPAFAKVVEDMQKSKRVRDLVYSLHHGGINMGKIADTIKDYFFLGSL